MGETYPSRFEMQHFRWGDARSDGGRELEYAGFGTVIRISMYTLIEGGFSVGPMTDPQLQGLAAKAFEQCGGLPALAKAAHWFANSR